MNKILTVLTFVIVLGLTSSGAYAETVNVSGNGAGSNNSTQINQNNTTNVNQNNNANINNNVNVNCNTGGNSASGNTGGNSNVNTGNCSLDVNVTNCVNTNNGSLNCPSPKPASPNPSPSVGGPGGNGGSSGGGGGSSSGGGKAPEVLGSTGSYSSLLLLIAGISLVFSGLGFANKALIKS